MAKLNELVRKVVNEQDLTKEEFDYLREKLPWREDRHRYYALIEGKDGTIIEYDKNIREQDNMYKVQAYTHSVNGPTVGHRLEGYFLLI